MWSGATARMRDRGGSKLSRFEAAALTGGASCRDMAFSHLVPPIRGGMDRYSRRKSFHDEKVIDRSRDAPGIRILFPEFCMETLTRIRQHPERSVPEQAAHILAAGHVAHVGFELDGQPFILPFSYHFDLRQPEMLYLHGSRGSRTLQALTGGARVCVTVTLLDGLVYSRDALHHSMNYRSVVCFGRAQAIECEEEKQRVLTGMITRYFGGRTAPRDYENASPKELAATQMLAVRIEEWSAKVRNEPANGPRDHEGEASTQTYGVINLP